MWLFKSEDSHRTSRQACAAGPSVADMMVVAAGMCNDIELLNAAKASPHIPPACGAQGRMACSTSRETDSAIMTGGKKAPGKTKHKKQISVPTAPPKRRKTPLQVTRLLQLVTSTAS